MFMVVFILLNFFYKIIGFDNVLLIFEMSNVFIGKSGFDLIYK